LQLNQALIGELKLRGFKIAIETNGTIYAPENIDWVCVSPKGRNKVKIVDIDELKLVFPQKDAPPDEFRTVYARNRFLQPMDGPNLAENTAAAVAYCLAHPEWRLSLQTHKMLGIR
jgi:organic radical activating enzyme